MENETLLEYLKTKDIQELNRLKEALEAVKRWKQSQEKFLEPIWKDGRLQYKWPGAKE